MSSAKAERVSEYWSRVLEENGIQNLTRLTTPEAFMERHFADVRVLEESTWLEPGPALDIGSGFGVPGLLHALLYGKEWVLAESEKRKAQFLERMGGEFAPELVRVWSGRGEDYLRAKTVGSVVCRAVGSPAAILKLIGRCSTWNNLILFRGAKWPSERSDLLRQQNDSADLSIRELPYHSGEADLTLVEIRNR